MRKGLVLGATLLLLLSTLLGFASASIDDPKIYYKFEKDSASEIAGSFSNYGTLGSTHDANHTRGGVPIINTVLGTNPGAAYFSNTAFPYRGGYLFSESDFTLTAEHTFSFWRKSNRDAPHGIMTSTLDGSQGWEGIQSASNPSTFFYRYQYGTSGEGQTQPINNYWLNDDKWHQYGIVKSGREVRAYRDGVLIGNTNFGNFPAVDSPKQIKLILGLSLCSGCGGWLSEGGLIDDFMYFDRALDASDNLLIYSSQRDSYVNANVTVIEYSTPGTYNWNAPSDSKDITVHLWGAGGAGGNGASDFKTDGPSTWIVGGGGGGGGYSAYYWPSLSSEYSATIVVGKGGNISTPQKDGEESSFNWGGTTTKTASGGKAGMAALFGGDGGTGNVANGGKGGDGGTGEWILPGTGGGSGGGDGAEAETDRVKFSMTGWIWGGKGRYGGGSGGEVAGNLWYYPSGNFYVYNFEGWQGHSPGGGGSGESVAGMSGGVGGDGRVIITYYSGEIIVLPPVSTVHSCIYPNQTIISLYDYGNSNVAVFNGSYNDVNAGYAICYDEIFGNVWTGENPWNCNLNNKVLGLTGNSNARTESPQLNNYQTNVCYGNLECNARSSCVGDERAVASISSQTNALAGNSSYYPLKICCSNAVVSDTNYFKRIDWLSEYGNPISNSGVNESVKAHVESSNPTDSSPVEIIIKRKADVEINKVTTNFISGSAEFLWKINDSAMNNGDGDFYFIASAFGKQNTSRDLHVVNKEECTGNLDINISGIANGGLYLMEIPVQIGYGINGPASDGRGLINSWTIAEDGFSTSNLTFTYTFNSAGTKTIHLKSRNGCGVEIEREISIFVIGNGVSAVSFISAPKYGQVFKFGSSGIANVPYNGTGSYVINASGSGACPSLTCIAGECPAFVQNNQSCPVFGTPKSNNLIYFNWSGIGFNFTKGGYGNVSGNRFFGNGDKSASVNDKAYNLLINYLSSGNNLQSRNKVNFTVGLCTDNGNKFLRTNAGGLVIGSVKTVNSTGGIFDARACKGEDGRTGTTDDCCPSGQQCTETAGCRITTNIITRLPGEGCRIYNQTLCNQQRVQSTEKCQPSVQSCEWSSIENTCKDKTLYFDPATGNILNTIRTSYVNLSSCDKETGVWRVNITTTSDDPQGPSCDEVLGSVIKTLSCGKPAFQVPFFAEWQIIIAIGIVLLIYGLKKRGR